MYELITLDSILSAITSQLGAGILAALLGVLLLVICLSLLNLDYIYSIAVSGIPFWILAINTDKTYSWLLGGLVIIYGIILFIGIKKLASTV